jgi:flagellar basal-body rod modification protein FlgD
MAVQAIGSLGFTETNLYTQKRPDELDKMDFLKMLITQIQRQDPLNPQDPSEFTAQLTQFSSLEQMITMNEAIQDLQLLQLSANNTQTAALLGKDVVYSGDTLQLADGQPAQVRFRMEAPAQNLSVAISDSAGNVVRRISLSDAAAGVTSIEWDGKDDNGNTLAGGEYHFSVSGQDSSGNSLTITPLTMGRVTGIVFEDGATLLDVEGARVALSDIVSVYDPARAGG